MRPAWIGPKVDSAKQLEEEIKKITDRRNRNIQFIRNYEKQSKIESEFFRLHGDRIYELAELDSKNDRGEISKLMDELKEIKHKSPFYKPIFASLHPSWMNVPHVRVKPKWLLNWEEEKRKRAESLANKQSAGRITRKNMKNNKNKSRRAR